jgi:hypothetical protein
MIHYRIHPPSSSAFNWWAIATLLVTTFLLPLLFYFRGTVKVAYMLNVAAVIIGTVTMALYSATGLRGAGPLTLRTVILDSTLADIIILWAKIPLGQIILRLHYPRGGAGAANDD